MQHDMIDEPRLRQLYLDQQLSIRAIAAREQVSTRTVYEALKAYRIPRRTNRFHSPAPRPLLDAVTVRQLYLDNHLSPSPLPRAPDFATAMTNSAGRLIRHSVYVMIYACSICFTCSG
jgi:hypothetical protein